MTQATETVKKMCERTIRDVQRLKDTVQTLRDQGIDAVQVDVQVSRTLHSIFRDFASEWDSLADIEPEPWYMDALTEVREDLNHADHVLGEERAGMYEFGWPWDTCIPEWLGLLKGVLDRLQ